MIDDRRKAHRRGHRYLGAAVVAATVAGSVAAPAHAGGAGADNATPRFAARELVAQNVVGRCSGIDPATFSSIGGFVDAVVAASGGFADAAAEQNSIDCATTLQLAAYHRDIDNPPVVVAIRRLLNDCDASNAAPRTCGVIRSVLNEAVIATSEGIDPLFSPMDPEK